MIHALILLFLLIGNPIQAIDELANKQYPLVAQTQSPMLPTLIGVSTFIAGLEYVGTPLQSRIIKKFEVKSRGATFGITVAKAALIAAGAYQMQDYAATFIHRHNWPLQAVASMKVMVNELAVLKSIYFHTLAATLPDVRWLETMSGIITQYESYIKHALQELNTVSFEVCDEKTLELITALQSDIAGLESNTIMLPFTYQALCEAACDDRPLCLQLAELKSKMPLGYRSTTLGNGVNKACRQMFLVQKEKCNEAIKHCKRLAAVYNGWDMTQGIAEFLKWKIQEKLGLAG